MNQPDGYTYEGNQFDIEIVNPFRDASSAELYAYTVDDGEYSIRLCVMRPDDMRKFGQALIACADWRAENGEK